MYIVTTAASTRSSVLPSDSRNDAAAPWKSVCTEAGRPISRSSAPMASTAPPSEAPGARLPEVADRKGRGARADARDRIERHLLARRRGDADLLQRVRGETELGLHLEH